MLKNRHIAIGALLALSAAGQVWAYDFEADGFYFNKLSDSTVELTYKNTTDYGLCYNQATVTVPQTVSHDGQEFTVVKIGDSAFRSTLSTQQGLMKDNLELVVLPPTVTEIGDYAFALRYFHGEGFSLPAAVTRIGRYAFQYNQWIEAIDIPASVKEIPEGCFMNVSYLQKINLHEGLESIGSYAFASTSLVYIYVEGTMPGYTAFPESVTTIGNYVFKNCGKLHDLRMSDNLTYSGQAAWSCFEGCARFESVTMSDGIRSIGSNCFKDCAISELTVRPGCMRFAPSALGNNANMTKLVIEASDEVLNVNPEQYCNMVDGTRKYLTTLEIGRALSYSPFADESEISEITILGDKFFECPDFNAKVYENATLNVPEALEEQFKADAKWGRFFAGEEQAWLEDVTFGCVADDGIIYVAPRRIAGLLPQFTPADAATWSNVTWTLSGNGSSRDDMIASLYTVNYWNPSRIKFPELQGYRPGECTLTVNVTNPADASEVFTKEFTVKVVEDPINAGADGYVDGTIILNEEWFGHTNGSLNYITADDEILYQAYSRENPGYSFGCTSQHGTIWAGKLIVASKQAADGGDPLPGGGRLVVADATTLKRLGSIETLEWDGISADGRAVAGATPDKVYVSSSNGIFIVDISNPAAPAVCGRISAGSDADGADLYSGQVGDMVTTAGHVFAIKQGFGVIIVDVNTDEVVKTIADANVQGITQTADGRVWYATVDSSRARFVDIDPTTLEAGEGRIMPESIAAVICSWGAWRSTSFKGNTVDNRILFVSGSAGIMGGASGPYYLWDVDTDPADLQPLFSMGEQTGVTDFGEEVTLMNYGTPMLDVRHNRVIAMAGRNGASSGGYRDHWILYVDAATGEVTGNFKLEPYYWFQSLPIFPDKADAAFADGFSGIEVEKGVAAEFDLREFVSDADNHDANIRFSAVGASGRAAGDIAEFTLEGSRLTVNPLAGGHTNFLFTAESNGRAAELSLPVEVRVNTGIGAAEAAGRPAVRVCGNRIYADGCAGSDFALYNAAGACVAAFTADSDAFVAEFDLAAGVYVLRGADVVLKVAVK